MRSRSRQPSIRSARRPARVVLSTAFRYSPRTTSRPPAGWTRPPVRSRRGDRSDARGVPADVRADPPLSGGDHPTQPARSVSSMTMGENLFPEGAELPSGAALVEEGLALGASIDAGVCAFCSAHGVRSEVDYKRSKIASGELQWSMIMGLASLEEQIEGLEFLHRFGRGDRRRDGPRTDHPQLGDRAAGAAARAGTKGNELRARRSRGSRQDRAGGADHAVLQRFPYRVAGRRSEHDRRDRSGRQLHGRPGPIHLEPAVRGERHRGRRGERQGDRDRRAEVVRRGRRRFLPRRRDAGGVRRQRLDDRLRVP